MRYRYDAVSAVMLLGLCTANGLAQDSPKKTATLNELRAAIDDFKRGSGKQVESAFDLAGYSFDWELRTGGNFTAVVISRNLKGTIAVFSPNGQLTTSVDTGEPKSIQLCDLDNDGVAEIVVDEVAVRATGIMTRDFVVYRVSDATVKELWEGESFGYSVLDNGRGRSDTSSSSGQLRCDPSGGGRPRPRLVYVLESTDSRGKTQRRSITLELQGDKLVEKPIPTKTAGS